MLTLQSLAQAHRHALNVEIYLLINAKDTDSPEILAKAESQYRMLSSSEKVKGLSCKVYIFKQIMKGKHAGVGTARKLLMDTAFCRFQQLGLNGVIVNLDADTIVDQNYFTEISAFFSETDSDAASIFFEHRLKEDESDDAIIQYELHLRYFLNMQRLICLPYAFQTIGSAMAVRSSSYAKEGGMNVRQAGEDFYFLHKYSKNLSLADITNTSVHPSSRGSDRVPFGTGKAVNDHYASAEVERKSYNPESFIALGEWLNPVEAQLTKSVPEPIWPKCKILNDFLLKMDYEANLNRICRSSNQEHRIKTFYAWFNAFMLFKYLHYARDNGRDSLLISSCLDKLSEMIKLNRGKSLRADLLILREYDKAANYAAQWRAGLISKLSMTSAS